MAHEDDKNIDRSLTDAMLDAIEPVSLDAATRERIEQKMLARVRASQPGLTTVRGAEPADWFEPVPGNRIRVLRQDDDTMSMIVRLEPGTVFPAHSHPADEETYVIEGETWFGDIHLVAGDYHLAPKGTEHGEVRTETGCVLLIRKASE
ncbi:MAG: cupin domain-containing protein [Pseudomonadota bacterium]